VLSPTEIAEKTKHEVMSRQLNGEHNHITIIANKSFQNVTKFIYAERE